MSWQGTVQLLDDVLSSFFPLFGQLRLECNCSCRRNPVCICSSPFCISSLSLCYSKLSVCSMPCKPSFQLVSIILPLFHQTFSFRRVCEYVFSQLQSMICITRLNSSKRVAIHLPNTSIHFHCIGMACVKHGNPQSHRAC